MTLIARRNLEQAAAALEAGRTDEAERLCRAVLQRDASDSGALYLTGRMAAMRGEYAVAVQQFSRAAQGRSGDPALFFHLGMSLEKLDRDTDALEAFRRSAAINPTLGVVHSNIGAILLRLNRPAEAAIAFESATLCDPRDAEAYRYLAMALSDCKQGEAAVRAAQRSIALEPNDAENQSALGTALLPLGRLDEAAAAYEAALKIKSEHLSALLGLMQLAARRIQHSEAAGFARRALAVSPLDTRAQFGLAHALTSIGQIKDAIAACELTIDNPRAPPRERFSARSAICMMQQYGGFSAEAIRQGAMEAGRAMAMLAPSLLGPPIHDRSPGRRLKIGYMSPDFRRHSVAYFFQRVLEEHDRTQFHFTLYGEVADPDPVTDWFRAAADSWCSTVGLTDHELAGRVEADRIDVLVDLAGHSAYNRLPVLAWRIAPVQATWLGYPGTTGVTALDWRISDAICDPPEEDEFSAERLWRMTPGFHAWAPPYDPAPVNDLPGRAGPLTFGSYSSVMKLSDETLALWARVLNAAPDARLVLKNGIAEDQAARDRLLGRIAAAGIDAARVEMHPVVWDAVQHLKTYGLIDVALDPTPYNGTTTICEALWMGVPTITLRGDRHAGRVGASLMTQVGLPQFIAETPEQYVQIAVRCNEARTRLAAVRAGLRERMARSPLCDVSGLARRLEDAYRAMWRERVERAGS